jgi:hypothetical protein
MANVASVEEAERLACLEGMRLASHWVRQLVIVESDWLSLIKTLQASTSDRASWLGIITEIKELSRPAAARVRIHPCETRRQLDGSCPRSAGDEEESV